MINFRRRCPWAPAEGEAGGYPCQGHGGAAALFLKHPHGSCPRERFRIAAMRRGPQSRGRRPCVGIREERCKYTLKLPPEASPGGTPGRAPGGPPEARALGYGPAVLKPLGFILLPLVRLTQYRLHTHVRFTINLDFQSLSYIP